MRRADTPPAPPVIAAGVQIGSVDVSGMTADEATAAVQDAYFAPVVVHVGHHGYSVSPHHFHTALPVGPAVQTALTAPADTAVPLKPTLDMTLVAKWVKTLAAKTYRAPVAGTLRLRNDRPFFGTRPSGSRPPAVPDAHADPRRDRGRHAHGDRRAAADAEGRLASSPSRSS